MNRSPKARIIFVTGTDTAVGKTLLTGLLLSHLRRSGCDALATKPFCSGGTTDIEILHDLQEGELTREEINPFYFAEAVAPLVASRKHRRSIRLHDVVTRIRSVASRCQYLLIEGSGGLLVPLGEGFMVSDLVANLDCEVIVVTRNRLGTINHTLLTASALQHAGIQNVKFVMMGGSRKDFSGPSNPKILQELLSPKPLFQIPFLGPNPLRLAAIKQSSKKMKKTLARILA